MSSDNSPYPHFLGIGAQKAGTTWLYRMLARHPDLWLPPVKELHYFNRLQLRSGRHPDEGPTNLDRARAETISRTIEWVKKGKLPEREKREKIECLTLIGIAALTDEWYRAIFRFAPQEARCGEITPEYALLRNDEVDHILKLRPDAKFIFVMRDPIERTWSALRMQELKGPLTDAQRLRRTSRPGFLAYSDYMATIARYRSRIGNDNLLLLYYDDIIERPFELLQRTCEFLQVQFARGDFRNAAEPVHVGFARPMAPELYERMRQVLQPLYQQLLSLRSPVVDSWYKKHFIAGSDGPP